MTHGTYSTYTNRACRCDECRVAATEYHRRYVNRTGKRASNERWAYDNARKRCNVPGTSGYEHWGGRGIRFLFASFEQFFAELGLRPEGLTLDRIDNDGNYEPGNVRWADRHTQRTNQRGMTQ